MKMIDIISQRIVELIEKSEKDTAEIKRNEMAQFLGCVPSQINYAISARFTPERGYIVESRRGGGGYIKIKRVQVSRGSTLMHIINSIGASVDFSATRIIIENCVHVGLISREIGSAALGAAAPMVLKEVHSEVRDKVRAEILKQILITQI